jgi:ribonuclease R
VTKSGRNFPTRDEILRFISDNPGESGKREVARAFGIRGSARIELKALLRQLAEEGLVQQRGKRLTRTGELPTVCLLDIVARDSEGGLLGVPVAWDVETDGKLPTVEIRPPKGSKGVVAGIGDRVLARTEKGTEKGTGIQYSARVMKRIDARRDAVLGVVRLTEGGNARLEPAVRRQAELTIEADRLGGAHDGDLVEARVLAAGRHGRDRGEVVSVVGNVASEKAVSLIAIHAHNIPNEFPETVIAEAGKAGPVRRGMEGFEDWLHLPLVTIDPADAKDHDDAVAAEADPEQAGGWIATVAIADVGWYVRPGSELDREALKRGNSVYFPDRVVPMLPERISNDLCSLREGEVRPALAVRMWFDADGAKRRHRFHRILMRSHARLSYTLAQDAADGKADDKTTPLMATAIEPLWQAWRCMQRGRQTRAPLELDLPERKILLQPDGSVDRVIIPERLDAHRLIEEFMVQANVCAAETLEERQQKLVYRVHDSPSLAKLEALREFLQSMNLSLVRAGNIRASHFNSILATVSGSDREELVNQVILRSQSQAEYSPRNIGHFGLNLMRYAHFTSPIRRYADLVVHRALIGSLGLGEGAITAREEAMLDVIAADISVAERRAMAAERETVDRLIATFLSERIGESFHGRVNGVTRSGLFVTLEESGADGFVPISTISREYQHFDEASHSLVGRESGLSYQIGQKVEVKLVEAAPVAGALRFEMLSEGVARKSVSRSARHNQRLGSSGRKSRGSRNQQGKWRKRH